MDHKSWVLTAEDLREWVELLVRDIGVSVVAPIEEDGVSLFREIFSADEVVFAESGKTKWSPKEYLFPRSEALYRYRFAGERVQLENPPNNKSPQILFGVRSCDAVGLARLDEIFMSGTRDQLYVARRERTTVVSWACAAADSECFCTAVGGSPVGEEGSDLQLVPLGGEWLLRVLTEKGEAIVEGVAGQWKSASAKETSRLKKLGEIVAQQIHRNVVNQEWSRVLEGGFEHSVWESLAEHCLGCSVCAYVCPSCSCFDMNHEADAWCGEQYRSWDACTFQMFTQHASGHNPRATRQERYRQRVLHKFAFNEEGQSSFRCVGCGRCVALCPAGLDIVETVVSAVTAIEEEGADAAR